MAKRKFQFNGKLHESKGACIQYLITEEHRTMKIVIVPDKSNKRTVKQYRLESQDGDSYLPCTKYQAKKHLTSEQLRFDELHKEVKSLIFRGSKSFSQHIEDSRRLDKLTEEDIEYQIMVESIINLIYTELK